MSAEEVKPNREIKLLYAPLHQTLVGNRAERRREARRLVQEDKQRLKALAKN